MGAAEERACLDLLRGARQVVLTTHVHPDADGLGSQQAMAELIEARGGTVQIVNADPLPGALGFLDPAGRIETFDAARHAAVIAAADVVISLDNADFGRLGPVGEAILASRGTKVTIDHHPQPAPQWDLHVVREDASSTAEVVHALMRQAGVAPSLHAATALYAGLVADTGRFRFGNTTARALAMASELVALGVSPPAIYAELEERNSEPFLRLFARTLADVRVMAGGRLVVLRVPQDALDAPGATSGDVSDIVNEALRIDGSAVGVLFRELSPGVVKVSLRSKGEHDVNRVARLYGGGGHRNASGVVMKATLEEAEAALVPELLALAST